MKLLKIFNFLHRVCILLGFEVDDFCRKVFRFNYVILSKNQKPFNNRFKFSNITRPIIIRKEFLCLFRNCNFISAGIFIFVLMCSWPAGPGAIARGYHNLSPTGLLNPLLDRLSLKLKRFTYGKS